MSAPLLLLQGMIYRTDAETLTDEPVRLASNVSGVSSWHGRLAPAFAFAAATVCARCPCHERQKLCNVTVKGLSTVEIIVKNSHRRISSSFVSSLILRVSAAKTLLTCIVIATTLVACQSQTPPAKPIAAPTPPPPAAGSNPIYQDQTAGISFEYPKGWQPHEKGDQVIFSVSSGQNVLNLAYPKLPWHIPNMIPIDRVRSGYVDSIKSNQIKDATEADAGSVTIPDATAERAKLTGHIDGKPAINEAVLIVHADHVYILSIHSDDAGYTLAKAALDAAVKSLKWTK